MCLTHLPHIVPASSLLCQGTHHSARKNRKTADCSSTRLITLARPSLITGFRRRPNSAKEHTSTLGSHRTPESTLHDDRKYAADARAHQGFELVDDILPAATGSCGRAVPTHRREEVDCRVAPEVKAVIVSSWYELQCSTSPWSIVRHLCHRERGWRFEMGWCCQCMRDALAQGTFS